MSFTPASRVPSKVSNVGSISSETSHHQNLKNTIRRSSSGRGSSDLSEIESRTASRSSAAAADLGRASLTANYDRRSIPGLDPIADPDEVVLPRVPNFKVTREPNPDERNRWVEWVVNFVRLRIWRSGEEAICDWAKEEWKNDPGVAEREGEPTFQDQTQQLERLRTEVRCSLEGYKELVKNQSAEISQYRDQWNAEQDDRLYAAEERLTEMQNNLYSGSVSQSISMFIRAQSKE